MVSPGPPELPLPPRSHSGPQVSTGPRSPPLPNTSLSACHLTEHRSRHERGRVVIPNTLELTTPWVSRPLEDEVRAHLHLARDRISTHADRRRRRARPGRALPRERPGSPPSQPIMQITACDSCPAILAGRVQPLVCQSASSRRGRECCYSPTTLLRFVSRNRSSRR